MLTTTGCLINCWGRSGTWQMLTNMRTLPNSCRRMIIMLMRFGAWLAVELSWHLSTWIEAMPQGPLQQAPLWPAWTAQGIQVFACMAYALGLLCNKSAVRCRLLNSSIAKTLRCDTARRNSKYDTPVIVMSDV